MKGTHIIKLHHSSKGHQSKHLYLDEDKEGFRYKPTKKKYARCMYSGSHIYYIHSCQTYFTRPGWPNQLQGWYPEGPAQGPHSDILMMGGKGGSDRCSFFISPKNPNFRICLPKKIQGCSQDFPWGSEFWPNPVWPKFQTQKNPSFPPPPSVKYVNGAPRGPVACQD